MSTLCIPLSATALSHQDVGGKAANLSRVLGLGIEVPPGFIIPRSMLTQFLKQAGIGERVERLLAASASVAKGAHDVQTVAAEYVSLKAVIDGTELPAELDQDIRTRTRQLLAAAAHGLVVRSSAVCEDGTRASFAGLFTSVIGARTEDAVLTAIRACWLSAWTPTALAYAARMGVSMPVDGMAVLVQVLVPATCSGVILTADPATGDPWRLVIQSVPGLARDLMAGGACADTTVLDWHSGCEIERRTSCKQMRIIPAPSGVAEEKIATSDQLVHSVDRRQAQQLSEIALRIDRAFATRMDIEWAWHSDCCTVVQARPLTALPTFFPHDLSVAQRSRTWRRMLPDPIDPLHAEGGTHRLWQRAQPANCILGLRIGREERDIHGYRFQTDGTARDFRDTFLWDGRRMESWLDQHEEELRTQWEASIHEADAMAREVKHLLASTSTSRELLPVLPAFIERVDGLVVNIWGAPQFLGWMTGAVLSFLIDPLLTGRDFVPDDLQLGLDTYLYRRTCHLQQLGRSIHEPTVRAAFTDLPVAKVMSYLIAHHPRCRFLASYESYCRLGYFTPPSWHGRERPCAFDNPIEPVQIMRDAMLGTVPDARELHMDLMKRRHRATDTLRSIILQADPERLERVDRALAWTQYWQPVLNGRGRIHIGAQWVSELEWECGSRLVREGLLTSPQEILLLARADLTAIEALEHPYLFHAQLQERRRTHEARRRLQAPEVLGDDQPAVVQPAPPSADVDAEAGADAGVFHGVAITRSSATGRSRVVSDFAAFSDPLAKDDIVVCDGSRTPYHYDWQGLFLRVRGVVIIGAFNGLHHACQIARECGAALIHLPNTSMSALSDGAPCAVDGASGVVSIGHA